MNRILFVLLLPVFLFSQIVLDRFEETGTPSGWTVGGVTAQSNFDYSPALEQNQSLQMTSTTGDALTYVDFAAQSEFWFFLKLKPEFSGTANGAFLDFKTLAGASQFMLWVYPNQLRVLNLTGNPYGGAITSGVEYGFLVHYVKGSGANGVLEVWFTAVNADGSWTKPGTKNIDVSNSDETADIGRILFQADQTSTATNTIDAVIVSIAELGNYTPPPTVVEKTGYGGYSNNGGFGGW